MKVNHNTFKLKDEVNRHAIKIIQPQMYLFESKKYPIQVNSTFF